VIHTGTNKLQNILKINLFNTLIFLSEKSQLAKGFLMVIYFSVQARFYFLFCFVKIIINTLC